MQGEIGGALTEKRMASKAVLLLTTFCIVAHFIAGESLAIVYLMKNCHNMVVAIYNRILHC